MNKLGYIALLCAVALLSYKISDYAKAERNNTAAHNVLRGLYSRIELFPLVESEGKKQYAWPADQVLPAGVIALYPASDQPLPLNQKYPLVYMKPNAEEDAVLVLLANGERQLMTFEELQMLARHAPWSK